jgi:hypothetical protein
VQADGTSASPWVFQGQGSKKSKAENEAAFKALSFLEEEEAERKSCDRSRRVRGG